MLDIKSFSKWLKEKTLACDVGQGFVDTFARQARDLRELFACSGNIDIQVRYNGAGKPVDTYLAAWRVDEFKGWLIDTCIHHLNENDYECWCHTCNDIGEIDFAMMEQLVAAAMDADGAL